MKLSEKRALVETLMVTSSMWSGVAWNSALDLGHQRQVGHIANRLQTEERASVNWHSLYEETCCAAAYRLIESSPTLRREWFGPSTGPVERTPNLGGLVAALERFKVSLDELASYLGQEIACPRKKN